MTAVQILFILVAAATLGAALMVVTTRNLIHSALWLIVALFGVAITFAILNAGFLAIAQVVIYIGAISILLIFAIMLTRRAATDHGPQFNGNWVWALVTGVVIFGGLVWMLSGWSGFTARPEALSPAADPLRMLGQTLVAPDAYALPFEVASVLLLGAMIGAIIIAWDRK